jgi:hypothetical protein
MNLAAPIEIDCTSWSAPTLIAALTLRAEARTFLWAEGEIESIPEAVDPLQAFAVPSGLVAEIGQDSVQKVLSDAFAPYRKQESDARPDEIEQQTRRCPTPQITIEAIMYCVRERGLAALKELANRERLLRCDPAARQQINERIETLLKTGTPS